MASLTPSATTVVAPSTAVPPMPNEFAHLALVAETAYQQSVTKLQAKDGKGVTLGVVLQAAMEATEAAARTAAGDAKRAIFVQVTRLLQLRPKNLIPPAVLGQLKGLLEEAGQDALQEIASLVSAAAKGLVKINAKKFLGILCSTACAAQ